MEDAAGQSWQAPCDEELMLWLGRGDMQAFECLLRRHRTQVVHFLYRMVQDREAAEELAQEVFLRVYRARCRYRPTARFTTWLYRIATNLALNWLRHERRCGKPCSLEDLGRPGEMPRSAEQPSVEEVLWRRAQAERVRRAVAALPSRQRAVVLLHKYQGMDYEQIAATLGCSVQAVKSLTFRAYANLRRALAPVASEGPSAVRPQPHLAFLLQGQVG
ncbi:MAG: sigma-70 family RNA polymerase sigma factor [Bryobacterales bacterium]|nr:sigma-70 family RNA polymerase sigma factor [Bryobacteraceae bacterium]MDW8129631.1 sigma-70 family RNA polymerase sigma factor [Bryobacterales bacterium]